MAGLYIHIPFCSSKCGYCAFYSVVSGKDRQRFVDALKTEMALRRDYLGGEPVRTIYFGGGSPSVMSLPEIGQIMESVYGNFGVVPLPEITFEANPDHLDEGFLNGLKKLGINRLSIGIQSFFDDDLRYLGRGHDSRHATEAIGLALNAGFENLTIDLIYGMPTLSDAKWNENLNRFFATGAQHLSAYALTVEDKTLISRKIKAGTLQPVEEERVVNQYRMLTSRCAENGFVHYETSNFARPGFESEHNRIYWTGERYIGLGPSAHSFDGHSRQWNIPDVGVYAENAGTEKSFEKEILSDTDLYNEYIMTSLRTVGGCDLSLVERRFGRELADHCLETARKHIAANNLQLVGNHIKTTTFGELFADAIAADMFVVD